MIIAPRQTRDKHRESTQKTAVFAPGGDNWNPSCLTEHVTAARQSVADHPFYLTEYNVGCCLGCTIFVCQPDHSRCIFQFNGNVLFMLFVLWHNYDTLLHVAKKYGSHWKQLMITPNKINVSTALPPDLLLPSLRHGCTDLLFLVTTSLRKDWV